MKGNSRYKHLKDDSKIKGLGSLFRGTGRKYWSLNLFLSGKPQNYIHFSAVPILARYRTLNPTESYPRAGQDYSFTIDDAQKWELGKIKDCYDIASGPKTKDYNQYCFIADVGGLKMYIPQLELARVLFYHDPYMARLSLQHNALNEDFYIQKEEDNIEIHVLSEAEYPLFYYNRDDNRRFLSWVLLDKWARESFESISANLISGQYRSGNYQMWDFQFSPPPLKGAELQVSGWHDYDSDTFIVWEIWGLTKLPSSISGEVDFVNPNYERTVGGKPTSGNGESAEAPEQYELDDDELSDADKATMHLLSEAVTISFDNPFITNRISSKTRSVSHTTGKDEKEVYDKNLSVNEKEVSGDLPGGSWNNLDDQTDDAHLYLSKFNTFLQMIDVLESDHGCKVLSKETVKLPKVGESKKHKLSDTQNPRCLAIVKLIYDGQLITLMEIDTSDGAAKLSTMMLRTASTEWVDKNLDEIKKGIIKKSLGWPAVLFEKHISDADYSGIPHPKSKHSGKLDANEIKPWAQRFVNWMNR